MEIKFDDYPEMDKAQFLLEFIKVCSNGSIRPYDHSYFLRKLQNSGLHKNEIDSLSQCCPPDSEIRDALEFKPYMLAALDKLADIIGLESR